MATSAAIVVTKQSGRDADAGKHRRLRSGTGEAVGLGGSRLPTRISKARLVDAGVALVGQDREQVKQCRDTITLVAERS